MNIQGVRGTYNIKECSERLGIGRSLMYSLVTRGEIPGVIRLGRRILISRAAIDEMLENQGNGQFAGDQEENL